MSLHPMSEGVDGARASERKASGKEAATPRGHATSRPGPAATALARAGAEGKRIGAAILEVLAGMRTPAEAAGALGVSQPRYYALESRALVGLVEACQPRPSGRQANPEAEVSALRARIRTLERDCARYQALARATQRTVGLSIPSAATPSRPGKGKRRRRPAVRALRAARALAPPVAEVSSSSPEGLAAGGSATPASPSGA